MRRRTQVIYIATDSLFSQRGAVLYGFDQFLAQLAKAQIPCVWITAWTRAQLDEPRRRLGQVDPYIGENGGGVYLPEDYFHLKGSNTIRLGRYTCIPVAKPQPAAAEALEELSTDLGVEVVPFGKLSPRELSHNTGLPAKEAELLRLRDFDELFFFAGANDTDVRKFRSEAKSRGMAIERCGQFWSLSCAANLGKCIRELGSLYDRALRVHAQRIGLRVEPAEKDRADGDACWPAAALDRMLSLTLQRFADEKGAEASAAHTGQVARPQFVDAGADPRSADTTRRNAHNSNRFYLHSRGVWDELIAAIAP